MEAKIIKAGAVWINEGDPVDRIWMLQKGSLKAAFPGGSVDVPVGSFIGVTATVGDSHPFTYTAKEDCQVAALGETATFLSAAFAKQHPDYITRFSISQNQRIRSLLVLHDQRLKTANELYRFVIQAKEKYHGISTEFHVTPKSLPGLDELEPLSIEDPVDPWLYDYHRGFAALLGAQTIVAQFQKVGILLGYMCQTSKSLDQVLSACCQITDYTQDLTQLVMNEDRVDLFDLLTKLYYKIGVKNARESGLEELVNTLSEYLRKSPDLPQDLVQSRLTAHQKQVESLETLHQAGQAEDGTGPAELMDSVNIILNYAEALPEDADAFKKAIEEYKKIEDKSSTEPDATRTRKKLTEIYYKIYIAAFQNSLMDTDLSTVMKMFFNFGYVDADLCGMENAIFLHDIADSYTDDPEHGVFTLYNWLRAIYEGKREPSITELESDFDKYVRELKQAGKFDKKGADRMLKDTTAKVQFELENLMPSACKITNGHLLTFCPVLCEDQFIKTPKDSIMRVETVLSAFEDVKKIDYSIFYHESMTVLCEKENIHDFMHVEIGPDIILTPVAGVRGAMWQECSVRNQLSPSRMLLPIFQMENLAKIVVNMCAEYRWEMCKRSHGAHWNDVTDPSITSLYTDYLQFFRKNGELSQDTKEKIKLQLAKCKQNFKECFKLDYSLYVFYEAAGSPRLNKAARLILCNECPFPEPVRTQVASNPLYSDIFDKRRIKVAQRVHFLKNLKGKLDNLHQPVPEIINEEIAYTQM